jgi:prepilin-type N-terminal cleavage/methylation domain-containing protein
MDKRGFTLLELLVVIAIIGILSATAIGAYGTYRSRAYEAVAISYMRSWVPAQELYLQKYGRYADADEQLAQGGLGVLFVPKSNVPYSFSIDSTGQATSAWWGRGTPTRTGLRYFYVDQNGAVLSSATGPPQP